MTVAELDSRSDRRKAEDERLANEPMVPIPPAVPGEKLRPLEAILPPRKRPVAVHGIMENGLIRILDTGVTIPERSRVIVVATDASPATTS